MKKFFVLFVLTLLVCGLFADELMRATNKQPILRDDVIKTRKVASHSNNREVPTYEFITPPTTITGNYFDYMPGSYNSTPVRVEADGSVYLIYHARQGASTDTRREYYAYIDANGSVINSSTISTTDLHEGYGGIDLDPETGDPFVSWHVDVQAPAGQLECVFTYDLFHVIPGLWTTPFVVIGEDMPPNTPNGTLDEFEWPYVHIGPSPEVGKRRVYVQANNGYAAGDPTENPCIAYADFNVDDLNIQSQLDWSYVTIPIFDNWNQSIPEWIRPFHSFDVSSVDGTVAFFGYNTNDSLYVCYNTNYAEGDWTYTSQSIGIDTWNPQNLDGTYVYADENGNPYSLFWAPVHAGHMTSVFHEGSDKMIMEINLGLHIVEVEGNYYPYETFPYIVKYDFATDSFDYIIANPEVNENAANPNYEWGYNEMYIPWDTDKDDIVDEYNGDGDVLMYNGWPIYYWFNDQAFHENLAKVALNDNRGWIVHLWQDGLKNKYYNDSGDDEYVDWATTAEIYIVVSGDGGETWSEPLVMNSKADDVNYEPAFANMMPAYMYLGDKIEDLGNNEGKIHLMFFDDNSFGSFVHAQGSDLGGNMMYASMKIDFTPFVGTDNETIIPSNAGLSQNYPNPFNPNTTIAYNLTEASQVSIEVFNVKGQKVKTLVNEYQTAGTQSVEWNGVDDNNTSVSSGVYFYKMTAGGRYTSTRKMILLK